MFVTETDGQIRQPSDRGLFYRDTRLVSAWAVEVNGRPWRLLSSAATSHFAAQIVLANPALPIDDGVNQRRCGTQGNSGSSTQCGADQRRNPLLTHSRRQAAARSATRQASSKAPRSRSLGVTAQRESVAPPLVRDHSRLGW